MDGSPGLSLAPRARTAAAAIQSKACLLVLMAQSAVEQMTSMDTTTDYPVSQIASPAPCPYRHWALCPAQDVGSAFFSVGLDQPGPLGYYFDRILLFYHWLCLDFFDWKVAWTIF